MGNVDQATPSRFQSGKSPTENLDFLAPAELVALTDLHHADAQIAYLRAKRIPHFVSGKGKPKVLRSAVLAQSGQSVPAREPAVQP